MVLRLIRNFIQLIWARYTANNLAYQSVSDSYQPVSRAAGIYFLIDNAKVRNNQARSKFFVQKPPFLRGIFRLIFAKNSEASLKPYVLTSYFLLFGDFWLLRALYQILYNIIILYNIWIIYLLYIYSSLFPSVFPFPSSPFSTKILGKRQKSEIRTSDFNWCKQNILFISCLFQN